MADYSLNINNQTYNVDIKEETTLLWVLREHLGLTGTKYGCGIALCGSCTVHVDGKPMRSCTLPISGLKKDQKITTIEGLSPNGDHEISESLDRSSGPTMRILPIRTDHAGCSLASRKPQSNKGRDKNIYE